MFSQRFIKNRGSTPEEKQLWREGIYDQIRGVMSMQGSLSIERMCYLGPVSRAGFYRSLSEQMPVEEEMEARSAIQRIAVEHRRRYGYRIITAELRRCGMLVNHKRVARIMREDNLLAVQPPWTIHEREGLPQRFDKSRIRMSLNRILPRPPECNCSAIPPSEPKGLGSV